MHKCVSFANLHDDAKGMFEVIEPRGKHVELRSSMSCAIITLVVLSTFTRSSEIIATGKLRK
jgi:hypothetical protein